MKAIVQDGYGSPDVLHLREVEVPVPTDDEVLVRVRATSVHPDVWHVVSGRPYVLRVMGSGLTRPHDRIPGTDVAGVVTDVGANVTSLRPGDEVFGETLRGHQWHNGGAYAEYVAVRADALARKPASISFEEAAATPSSGYIALQVLCDQGQVQRGQRVLVNGAGGGVGTFVVQLAHVMGAHVTAVDTGDKLSMLSYIGADEVVDYDREDFTQRGEQYDLIVDIPGNRTVADYKRALTSDGAYVLVGHDGYGASAGRWLGSITTFAKLESRLPSRPSRPMNSNATRLEFLRTVMEAGAVVPVVGGTFPLEEAADAIRLMATGTVLGKLVLTV